MINSPAALEQEILPEVVVHIKFNKFDLPIFIMLSTFRVRDDWRCVESLSADIQGASRELEIVELGVAHEVIGGQGEVWFVAVDTVLPRTCRSSIHRRRYLL